MSDISVNRSPYFSNLSDFVLLDLEFTAWEGSAKKNWSKEGEHREIIALGAIKVNLTARAVVDEYACLVLPNKNPQLSTYIQDLTDISQARVNEEGEDFPKVLEGLHRFCGGRPVCCYGWDSLIIAENLSLNNIAHELCELSTGRPFSVNPQHEDAIPLYGEAAKIHRKNMDTAIGISISGFNREINFEFINIKPWIFSVLPEARGYSSGQVSQLLGGSPPQGQLHDPLFDVKSVAHTLFHLFEKYSKI